MSLGDVKQEPYECIIVLKYIRAQLTTIRIFKYDKYVMIHILNNLPVEYENAKEKLDRW